MSELEKRVIRMEGLLEQLIGMVARNNAAMTEFQDQMATMQDQIAEVRADVSVLRADTAAVETRLTQRIDTLEQRLTEQMDAVRGDLTLLRAHSDHFAQKIGVLERDVAEVRKRP